MGILELIVVHLAACVCIAGFMTWKNKRKCKCAKPRTQKEIKNEYSELQQLRTLSLSVPMTELARPTVMEDIVGQQEGIRALRAALCGRNPQHVIIYGPPGVGKTCASRLVLDEAKARNESPFNSNSKFIEIDATCVRFDERAIADPLIGSVHDPIYQGAGPMGAQGVPQPKIGAASRAHCGILFLDEIGELHPLQMNKLLKVLEDRKVFFESAYYSKDNNNIPPYIHDIFQNGMPADFRLIGATTRSPSEISPALRSRCVEIFFSPLSRADMSLIAENALRRSGFSISEEALYECSLYSASGRDAVNIVQLAQGIAEEEQRERIEVEDIEWVASTCKYSKRYTYKIPNEYGSGVSVGLGVAGSVGAAFEIECTVKKRLDQNGIIDVSGAVTEEEIENNASRLRRKSMARASVENVSIAFAKCFGIDCGKYDISYNIPGGIPIDGPSAGAAFAVALMSALTARRVSGKVAMTGEITQNGEIRPVGGIAQKIEAACSAGAELVVVPKGCLELLPNVPIRIVEVSDVKELMRNAFVSRVKNTASVELYTDSAM